MKKNEYQVGVRLNHEDRYVYERLVHTNTDLDPDDFPFDSHIDFFRDCLRMQYEKHFERTAKSPQSPYNVKSKLTGTFLPFVPLEWEKLDSKALEKFRLQKWQTWQDRLYEPGYQGQLETTHPNFTFEQIMQFVHREFLAVESLPEFTGPTVIKRYHDHDNGDLIERWETNLGIFEHVDSQSWLQQVYDGGYDPYRWPWRVVHKPKATTEPSIDLSKADLITEYDMDTNHRFAMVDLDEVRYTVITPIKDGKPCGKPIIKRLDGKPITSDEAVEQTPSTSDMAAHLDGVQGAARKANEEKIREKAREEAKKIQWLDRVARYHKNAKTVYGSWWGEDLDHFDTLLSKAEVLSTEKEVESLYQNYFPPIRLMWGKWVNVDYEGQAYNKIANIKKNRRLQTLKEYHPFVENWGFEGAVRPDNYRGMALRKMELAIDVPQGWGMMFREPMTSTNLRSFCADGEVSLVACFTAIAATSKIRTNYYLQILKMWESVKPILEKIRTGDLHGGKAFAALQTLKAGGSLPGCRPRQWSFLIHFLQPKYWGDSQLLTEQSALAAMYLSNTRLLTINTQGFLGDDNSQHQYEEYCQFIKALSGENSLNISTSQVQEMLHGTHSESWSKHLGSSIVGEILERIMSYREPDLWYRNV